MVTVITMYRGYDAELFVHVVNGVLTDEEKDAWRSSHNCDDHHCDDDEVCDHSNMFFRTLEICQSHEPCSIINVDGEWRATNRLPNHELEESK